MVKSLLTLFIALSISVGLAAQTGHSCSLASRLTDDEARILLYVTPAAIQARLNGTDVDMEPSAPSKQYPANSFFVAALISRSPKGGGVLGNGILGYFAVNRQNGDVESTTDFSPVSGNELSRVQGWMRRSHCMKLGVQDK